MADKDRPDTDEDMGNSSDEKPQPRRRNPNPAPFAVKMVPHATNSAERAKSAAPFRERTGNERNRNKSLPRSTGLPKVSLFRADGFYGTSSLFEAQSSSEISDPGAEQSGVYLYGGERSPDGLQSDEADVEKTNAGASGTAERFNSFKTPFWRNIKYGSGDHDEIGSSAECASSDTAGASGRSGAEEDSNLMDGISSSPVDDAPSTSTPRPTASKSPPCKMRRMRTFDPREMSLDSGFENSTTSDIQENLMDYQFDEEFTSESVGREGSVSVYEIVNTDGPEVVRVESGCTSRGFTFGSPIGDRETSETFGSSGRPAADVWQKMPVLLLNSDMSVDSAYEYNLPPRKQADKQPDPNSASKNEMTPDESDSPIVGTDSSDAGSEEFDHTEDSTSTAPDSGRKVIVNGPTVDAVESDSYISEMENCILFDTGADDWFDEGASIDLVSPTSVSAMVLSEVKTLNSDEKRDGTSSGGSDRTSSDRLFTSTPEASNATEQRSAQRWSADH